MLCAYTKTCDTMASHHPFVSDLLEQDGVSPGRRSLSFRRDIFSGTRGLHAPPPAAGLRWTRSKGARNIDSAQQQGLSEYRAGTCHAQNGGIIPSRENQTVSNVKHAGTLSRINCKFEGGFVDSRRVCRLIHVVFCVQHGQG